MYARCLHYFTGVFGLGYCSLHWMHIQPDVRSVILVSTGPVEKTSFTHVSCLKVLELLTPWSLSVAGPTNVSIGLHYLDH